MGNPNNSGDFGDDDDEDDNSAVRNKIQDEKETIMSMIPNEYKEKFGTIGFGKWGKKWHPVLIRSPYDVRPGNVQRDWFVMYEKVCLM